MFSSLSLKLPRFYVPMVLRSPEPMFPESFLPRFLCSQYYVDTHDPSYYAQFKTLTLETQEWFQSNSMAQVNRICLLKPELQPSLSCYNRQRSLTHSPTALTLWYLCALWHARVCQGAATTPILISSQCSRATRQRASPVITGCQIKHVVSIWFSLTRVAL